MRDDTARKPAKSPGPPSVLPLDEKQDAERQRWIEDALEDDEVYEALASLHARKKVKGEG